MKLICTDCHTPIPHGTNVSRSVSFVRVDYCQPCAKDRGIVVASERQVERVA